MSSKKNKKSKKNRDLEGGGEEGSELAVYLLVRTDLGMGKGKIGAQCGHAIEDLMMRYCGGGQGMGPMWRRYRRECGSRKICYGVSEGGLWQVVDYCRENSIPNVVVTDAGRTQVVSGTVTCAAVGPISASGLGECLRGLKLL